jgi:hypothetical protein
MYHPLRTTAACVRFWPLPASWLHTTLR